MSQKPVEPAVPALRLTRINNAVYRVEDVQGQQVGHLKWIGGHWKFKAVGHDADGAVVPGGGPFTDRHNMAFAVADAALVSAGLLGA